MNKQSLAYRLVRNFLIVAASFLVLLFLIYVVAIQFLKSNGIAFQNKDFDFPSALKITGLQIEQPGLSVQAGNVALDWNWRALLKGNFSGNKISVLGLQVRQEKTATETNDSTPFSLPSIDYKTIEITGAAIQMLSPTDTLFLQIPDLLVAGLKTGETIYIDSLINRSSVLKFKYQSEPETIEPENNEFSLDDIPGFEVKALIFSGCDFLIQSDSGRQSVTGFDVELTGVKSKSLLSADLKKLAFVYQDTLHVQANLDSLTINNKNTAHLNNLSFNFPGLQLQVSELVINGFSSPEFEVSFANSAIQNRFMKMFFPAYALKAAADETLFFEGKLKYANSAIYIRDFDGKLGPETKLKGNAGFDYSGEQNIFDFEIQNIQTSLFELSRYFGYKLPKEQKEVVLAGNFELAGTSQKFRTRGLIVANGMPLNLNVLADYTNPVVNSFDVDFKAGRFDLAKLYSADSIDFEASGLALKTTLKTDTGWNLKSLHLALTGDSMRVYNYPVEKPDIQLSYKPKNSWISISTLSDSIRFFAETNGNALNYKNLSVAGNFAGNLPLPDSISGGFTRVKSNFIARYNAGKTAWSGIFALDSLCFLPDSGAAFLTQVKLNVESDKESGYKLDAAFGEGSTLVAKVPASIFDWLKTDDKFASPVPEIQLKCKTEIDSTLVYRFTGKKGYFDLNNFEIKTEDNEIEVDVEMPFLRFDDYSAKNFNAEIDINSNLNYADIQLESFQNPLAAVEKVSIASKQISTDATAFNVGFYLPEVDENISFTAVFSELTEGFKINFEEVYNLTLGKKHWKSEASKGIFFDRNYQLTNSSIALSTGAQRIGFDYNNETATVEIDSLGLQHLVALFVPGTNFEGVLNAGYNYNLKTGEMNWNGTIPGFTFDSIFGGTLVTQGKYNGNALETFVDLQELNGDIKLNVSGAESKYLLKLDIKNFDLAYLNSFPGVADAFRFEGVLNSKLQGSYDGELLSSGYVAFGNNKFVAENYGLNFGISHDTIWLKNSQVNFHSFGISDAQNNKLTVDGKVDFAGVPSFNIKLSSSNFAIFGQPDKKQQIFGNIALATDLLISGTSTTPSVRGWIKTLPGGFLNYTYKSTVKLDEREKVVTFTDFSGVKNAAKQVKPKTPGVKTNWNVDVELGRTEIYVLIDETVQDNAKLTATGNLQMRTGAGSVPLIYGSINSTEGSVFYDAPMVSDVNMKIENAAITWKGDVEKPILNFRGSEAFRISAAEVPGSGGGKSDKIAASVLATVNDCTLENFVLNFDVKSNNAALANYLNRFTPETRQSMAINLLLFGSLETMGNMTGSGGVMSTVVGKLNELSRKNIKKADLSFYADTQTADNKTQESIQKLGYSFSEGFFNEKVKLTVGGNIDFSDDEDHGKKFNPLGTIQLDYVLKENPEINLFAARKDIYKGVFDGQVQESGAGISFRKRFRNLFDFSKKEKTHEK